MSAGRRGFRKCASRPPGTRSSPGGVFIRAAVCSIPSGPGPRIHDRRIPPDVWLPVCLRTYLERDVRSLSTIGNLEAVERFLSLCAGRSAQLLNYSSLAPDCGVSVDTVRRRHSVLEAIFENHVVAEIVKSCLHRRRARLRRQRRVHPNGRRGSPLVLGLTSGSPAPTHYWY
jgi:hypothetical protein